MYIFCFYFFYSAPTTEMYSYCHTLSLLDALPILEVSQEPAAVALRVIDQGGRRFLVAAVHLVGEQHLPAGAAQQGGLDEVVTQDLAAQRLAPRQHRQQIGRAHV